MYMYTHRPTHTHTRARACSKHTHTNAYGNPPCLMATLPAVAILEFYQI